MPTTVTSRGDLEKGNFMHVESLEALTAQKAQIDGWDSSKLEKNTFGTPP
jgi:hypothetical protein